MLDERFALAGNESLAILLKKKKKKYDTFLIVIDSAGKLRDYSTEKRWISNEEVDNDSRRTETREGSRVYNIVTSIATITPGIYITFTSIELLLTRDLPRHADRKISEVGIANLNSIGMGESRPLLLSIPPLSALLCVKFCHQKYPDLDRSWWNDWWSLNSYTNILVLSIYYNAYRARRVCNEIGKDDIC